MENIYGNLQGIKSNYIKQLQKLYEQRQPSDRIYTRNLNSAEKYDAANRY